MKSRHISKRAKRLSFCLAVLALFIFIIWFIVKVIGSFLFGDISDASENNSFVDGKPVVASEKSSVDSSDKRTSIPKNTEFDFSLSDTDFTVEIDASAYESVICTDKDIHRGNLILVNNEIEYVFGDNEDTELSGLLENSGPDFYVKDYNVKVASSIIAPINNMLGDFAVENGKLINVISGHRTLEYQQGLYDNDLNKTGLDYSLLVAKPAHSEHHTGLAVDFQILRPDGSSESYDGAGEEKWINDNCHKYGFVVRYAADKTERTFINNEPWHFRYVGIPHAFFMVKYNLCHEEYIDTMRYFRFGQTHLGISCLQKSYEVYYVPATGASTSVPVPSNASEYEISGNNIDGFIVTALLKD